MKNKIRDNILDYCNRTQFGRSFEFLVEDLDKIVDAIFETVKNQNRSDTGWEKDFRGERNSIKGDME